ncbi:Sulfate transporter 2.1 [Capsicum baccatum]|uniref:Sulfate transporter 2.1 n=1 Tax=Capsicum baccatum TaxID=33114 RepID=A0A2G2VGH8_CAPBA|nr:Sulfate transporter 2.1 [Capsicum baccatum]
MAVAREGETQSSQFAPTLPSTIDPSSEGSNTKRTQSIGYATLAKLDPQYGLYTSVIPPLIYAKMGSSREIVIEPVAVVSLLLSSMIPKLEDPTANPIAYRKLVLTVTFFAGIFQAAFGLLRLGFLVDFLSHAAIVGFMAGAACVIGLQQLKSLLGIANFTKKTDIISVLTSISQSMHTARKYKKLFWLAATAPLLSVILSTLVVFLTRADKHGVKIVKRITGELNPSSVHELQFNSPHTAEAAKIGLIVALVALTDRSKKGLSKIGSLVGKPLMVDQNTEKKVSLNYARLLVEVELDFTILELIMFKNENENIVEQKVTYEWRPILCKHGKKYGHSEEQCSKKKGSKV